MRAGADVVYQARFVDGGWRGLADFVERQPDGSYEVVDTKLARHAKPATSSSSASTPSSSGAIQGRRPSGCTSCSAPASARPSAPEEFVAYYRRVRARLERFVADPPADRAAGRSPTARSATSSRSATQHWDDDDHLIRVAGHAAARRSSGSAPPGSRRSPRSAARRRAAAGRARAGDLREAPPAGRAPARGARERARRATSCSRPSPSAASRCCPSPRRATSSSTSRATRSGTRRRARVPLGDPRRRRRRSRRSARTTATRSARAFEQFVDLVHERLARVPRPARLPLRAYEITALKRLMGRYGTREDELDDLLRREVFVDLYEVVRNGIRTSRPGYGLKELEAFSTSSARPRSRTAALDRRLRAVDADARPGAARRRSTTYNDEDCIATLLLRDWLLELRDEAVAQFGPFPPAEPRGAEAERRRARSPSAPRSAARCSTRGEDARRAAARLPRRERKPVWWAFFDRHRDDAGRAARGRRVDRRARARRRARAGRKRSLATRSRSRRRSTSSAQGRTCSTRRRGESPATIDRARPRAAARSCSSAGRSSTDVPLPPALIPGGPYNTTTSRTRSRGSAARCSPATAATRRSSRSSPRRRSTATCRRPTSTR